MKANADNELHNIAQPEWNMSYLELDLTVTALRIEASRTGSEEHSRIMYKLADSFESAMKKIM